MDEEKDEKKKKSVIMKIQNKSDNNMEERMKTIPNEQTKKYRRTSEHTRPLHHIEGGGSGGKEMQGRWKTCRGDLQGRRGATRPSVGPLSPSTTNSPLRLTTPFELPLTSLSPNLFLSLSCPLMKSAHPMFSLYSLACQFASCQSLPLPATSNHVTFTSLFF